MDQEKVCANTIPVKRLLIRIGEELSKLNSKNTHKNNTQIIRKYAKDIT